MGIYTIINLMKWETFEKPEIRENCMAVSPPKPYCHTFGSYSFEMSAVLQVFNQLFWNVAERLFS